MGTPKTLTALRAIEHGYKARIISDGHEGRLIVVENPDYQEDNGSAPNLVIDVAELANLLSAPDVGVGLTRYFIFACVDDDDNPYEDRRKDPEGEWVRFEDVAPLIAAARAVPADVELETTEKERDMVALGGWISGHPEWTERRATFMERLLRDIDTLTAALAASTAREKAKDEEIAGLREDKERLDWLDNVNIRSNERNGTVYGWKYDINHNRAALTDHNLPAFSVREAIDAARSPDRIAEIRSRSLREQARLKAFDEQFPGERERALAALSGRKPDKEGT